MNRKVTNVAASVRERLANHARKSKEEFGIILRRYFFERFLYRLGSSTASSRFVLKGAMLLRLWADQPYRATADLDLLRKGSGDDEALTEDLHGILSANVEPSDGVIFDPDSLTLAPIRIEDEYGGRRIHFLARLERARDRLQVDIGVGDAAWPAPTRVEYPTLLISAVPRILAYARETVIAEKLEAMILLGPRNSRIKDFFDVHYLAENFAFEGHMVAESIRRTLARRNTPIPGQLPVGLTANYWNDSTRAGQVRAFARRARLNTTLEQAQAMRPLLTKFLWPPLQHLDRVEPFNASWPPGGPWQMTDRPTK